MDFKPPLRHLKANFKSIFLNKSLLHIFMTILEFSYKNVYM